MIVVDSNVIAYFFIEGDQTRAARALRETHPAWRVPPLWQHEYLNILATYTRAGGMPSDIARELWRAALDLLQPSEHDVDMTAALILATDNRISAYDAQYVTLAEMLGTKLVTEDQKLLDIFPDCTMSLQD